MTAFRLIQISDTHLGAAAPFFDANWEAVARYIADAQPDLVINSGDVSFAGEDSTDDLAHAAARHDALGVPVMCIPGNHDTGDNPLPPGMAGMAEITADRLAAWRARFGADFWRVEAGDWTLLGLNAQLLDSGLDAEAEQGAFLDDALARAAGRPLGVFIHKPLFLNDPEETGESLIRYVPEAARRALLPRLARADVRFVASGHVHQQRELVRDGIAHLWCPSAAFVLPDARQPVIGAKRVGLIEYELGEGGFTHRFVRPDGMTEFDIDDFDAF